VEIDNPNVVVSNTGPLISAFQSDSFEVIATLLGVIHTSAACRAELIRHGWQSQIDQAGVALVIHTLTAVEDEQAMMLARRIANHPISKDRNPLNHLGEAEAMTLAQRAEFSSSAILLDEIAARGVAIEDGLIISGFAGALLAAVERGLLTAEELKARLEDCRKQGTHYSLSFIEQVYQAAQEVEA
jgi:predicted nucleic acid-binding protein